MDISSMNGVEPPFGAVGKADYHLVLRNCLGTHQLPNCLTLVGVRDIRGFEFEQHLHFSDCILDERNYVSERSDAEVGLAAESCSYDGGVEGTIPSVDVGKLEVERIETLLEMNS